MTLRLLNKSEYTTFVYTDRVEDSGCFFIRVHTIDGEVADAEGEICFGPVDDPHDSYELDPQPGERVSDFIKRVHSIYMGIAESQKRMKADMAALRLSEDNLKAYLSEAKVRGPLHHFGNNPKRKMGDEDGKPE